MMLNVAKWHCGKGTNRIPGAVTCKSQTAHLKRLKNTFEWAKHIVELCSTLLTLGREKRTLFLCSRLIEAFTYFKRLFQFH